MKLVLLLVFLSFSATAQDYHDYYDGSLIEPAEGMWFDKDEPGRGLSLEIQDQRLLITYFGYQADGDAQWWQGVGSQEGDSNVYTGGFIALKDGQCNNCPYMQPSLDTDNEIGDFTLTFSNGNEAFFEWDGKDMDLSKYYYGYENQLDRAKGLWVIRSISNDATASSRDFLLYETIEFGSERTKVLTGIETRTFNFAAATRAYVPYLDKEVIVFAYKSKTGTGRAYSITLDHVKGGSDVTEPTVTGMFVDLQSETFGDFDPVEAVRVSDLAHSHSLIEYYTDVINATSTAEQLPTTKQFGSGTQVINSNITDAMKLLDDVLTDLYDNL